MASDRGAQIIEEAKKMGAAMAGIASIELLKISPSHKMPRRSATEMAGVDSEEAHFNEVRWPVETKSTLVIAVSHPPDEPELDWWDVRGSPGNRTLLRINRELSVWIEAELGIKTHRLPYFIEKGGIYLKDAAVLGGLGCIGRNNLLVTPELGPRVRLRAMLLEDELTPTGPIAFDPCVGCEELCRKACLRKAYEEDASSVVQTGQATPPGRDGRFSRAKCMIQMMKDVEDSGVAIETMEQYGVDVEGMYHTKGRIRYCRRCELACPVGNHLRESSSSMR